MFGIYLIHDNPFIRHFIWIDLFHNAEHYYGKYLVLRSITEPIIVFLVCLLIELLRRKIITILALFKHIKTSKEVDKSI
ncbi:hypothetical protein COL91_28575 [Bacillus pseudomycoides]|nr:hypothetical protein COO02_24090 [Bacillus pseudomycoides]PGA78724.1 hypothetical protein COL91_28575 [Bacillus pseudomycoides]